MNSNDAFNTRKISEILLETKNRLGNIPEGSIRLFEFDSSNEIGVGISSDGEAVLVLPGQSSVTSFETKYAAFDPWVELNEIEDNRLLVDKAILKCKLDSDNLKTTEAIAAIFVGVIDLQKRFGECGAAIWQMKAVFDSGFQLDISENSIVGLIGEILVLMDSGNIEVAFDYWRNENFAKYDFSGSNLRLDAKATLSEKRIHHFSSNQVPGINPEITYIASIIVNKVERGTSFSDFISFFLDELSDENQSIAIRRVIETLGIHPSYIADFQFDYETTKASIRYLASEDIPRPIQYGGVLSMNWKADIEFNSPNFIDFDFPPD